MSDKIGYSWLMERYGVEPVQPLPVSSEIGKVRRSVVVDGLQRDTYLPSSRPDKPSLAAHLTFALKHEGVHLELLARLFTVVPERELGEWISAQSVGQYARRAGFLYEWLTGRTLPGIADATTGNYVDAIDADLYVTSTAPTNNSRWRVRDNLPGTRDFCPTIRRTPAVIAAESYNPAAEIESLQIEYGTDILLRSASWLTTKESRASFQIEQEQNQVDRIKRFAAVMERDCGEIPDVLSPATLAKLQEDIIGGRTVLKQFGLRESPVFVGGVVDFRDQVDYIAPHFNDVGPLIKGLKAFVERTTGASSLARAAATAFGFVYIHPFADGNGRLHRFMVNDVLRRDGAVQRPFLLPVSATIVSRDQERAAYAGVLESFSKPLMTRYRDAYELVKPARVYSDGISSNFEFAAYDDALPTWRYPDLTPHVAYVATLVDKTIRHEMRNEASFLRSMTDARSAVKNVLDGPDPDIDRIIRSVRESHGLLSNKLRKEFPMLADEGIAQDIVQAVTTAFATHQPQATATAKASDNEKSPAP